MATETLIDLPNQLETLFQDGTLGNLADGELLARFIGGDAPSAEAAFAVLVDRHAPMVMRVCRDALGNAQDAEDASQAVFLILARGARSVRRRESAASWLYGAARRVAARARRDAARRHEHERRRARMAPEHTEAPGVPDTSGGIYAEIDALPEIYRSALVLCYLEGLSHEQATSRLSCPIRTLQSRLLRAKERLRERLARRGVALPEVLPPLPIATAPTAAWIKATAAAARAFAAGQAPLATAGVRSATLSLARSTLRAATIVPRLIVGAVVTASLAAVVAVLANGLVTDPPPPPPNAGEPARAAAPPEKDPNNRTLVLRVVRRDFGTPIAGAEVTVEIDSGARAGLGGEPELLTRTTTDPDGRCRIEFPRVLPREIYITARKGGYANRGYGPLLEPGRRAIPREHTMEMERGVAIGGIVKDREGKAVAGATVVIMARAGTDASPDTSYVPEVKVTTDADGRWRFGEMPTGWNWAYFRVTHPDYVPSFMQRDFPQPTDFLLKAKKAEIVLDAGLPLAGRLLDDRGRPIAGAHVGLGQDRRIAQREFPGVATDAEGRFRFDHVPAGTQTVTAQAPGRAPELVDLVVAPGMKPVEFRLGPGHRVRGRIIAPDGKPLDGVTVQAMNWKGHMSLDWTTRTDAEGRFIWDSAPAEPVLLTLTRPGYTMIAQREFRPDRDEMTVTMYRPIRVRGQVTDASTGRPIERFTVVAGAYWRGAERHGGGLGEPQWERGWPQPETSGGTYEVEYSHPQFAAVAVRIEAEGYVPATSDPFEMEAGDVRFDARLEPGVGPSGVVHGPDGRQLEGAAVILSTRSARAQLYNGKFHEGAYPRVVTGSDGRFHFPPQSEPFRVFVYHEEGFAEADEKALADGSPLTMRPWGRIQGTVKIGSRTAAGVQIGLYETNGPLPADQALPITQSQQTQTDPRGRYVFEHVIPARLSVMRLFAIERSGGQGTGSVRTVLVEPGRTAFADLGGTGRPVIGRFTLPAGIKPGAIFPGFNQTLHPILPEPSYPANLNAQEREAWLAQWLTTPEGMAYSDTKLVFDTNVRPDGRFRIEDVPAGRYELHAQVHEPGNGISGRSGPELANVDLEINIPEIPGGRSDEPLDLGTIELRPFKPPR